LCERASRHLSPSPIILHQLFDVYGTSSLTHADIFSGMQTVFKMGSPDAYGARDGTTVPARLESHPVCEPRKTAADFRA
jgi:hypothetical protein